MSVYSQLVPIWGKGIQWAPWLPVPWGAQRRSGWASLSLEPCGDDVSTVTVRGWGQLQAMITLKAAGPVGTAGQCVPTKEAEYLHLPCLALLFYSWSPETHIPASGPCLQTHRCLDGTPPPRHWCAAQFQGVTICLGPLRTQGAFSVGSFSSRWSGNTCQLSLQRGEKPRSHRALEHEGHSIIVSGMTVYNRKHSDIVLVGFNSF